MLAIRVSEIPAFEQIDKVSKSDAFAASLGKAAESASDSMAGSAPPRTGIGETAETDRGTAQPGGSHNDPLGYNSARREWAKQLKIDPYPSNEARLKAMGIEGRPVREFFRNRYFTPTLQTALVAVLEALGSVAGRADVLAYATNAVSEVQARFAINSMLMLAQYNRLAAPR